MLQALKDLWFNFSKKIVIHKERIKTKLTKERKTNEKKENERKKGKWTKIRKTNENKKKCNKNILIMYKKVDTYNIKYHDNMIF